MCQFISTGSALFHCRFVGNHMIEKLMNMNCTFQICRRLTENHFRFYNYLIDRLCGVVVKSSWRSRGPDSIPGATTFSEK
jgi:hypothetical protein